MLLLFFSYKKYLFYLNFMLSRKIKFYIQQHLFKTFMHTIKYIFFHPQEDSTLIQIINLSSYI